MIYPINKEDSDERKESMVTRLPSAIKTQYSAPPSKYTVYDVPLIPSLVPNPQYHKRYL